MKVFLSLFVLVLSQLFLITSCAQNASLTIDLQSVYTTTRSTLVSFNLDWWPNSNPEWFRSGILNIDLEEPLLLYTTSKLAPAYLRVGGSDTDIINYQIGIYAPCKEGLTCLNMTRFSQVLDFCKATGLELVFGLNEMYNDRQKGEPWDSLNTQSFLRYISSMDLGPIFGFELGNELDGKLTPQECAKDYQELRSLINQYWPDASKRPKLIGPDDNLDDDWWKEFVKLTNGVIDIYTYHHYNGYGLDPELIKKVPTKKFLQDSVDAASTMLNIVNENAPKAELWLGEGAAAWHSGQDHTTNAYVSSLYYLNALGTTAQHKHTGFQRQTLMGGEYELVDKTTISPNPDYYTAYMWKQLMGDQVLKTNVTSDVDFFAYAHCTKGVTGAVTLAVINVSNSTAYQLNLPGIIDAPREEYLFTAPNGDLRSQSTLLNGVKLEMKNNQLPPFPAKKVTTASPVVVQPLSYGFVVFNHQGAKACQ